MNISLKRKICMTAIFFAIYAAICSGIGFIIGLGVLHLLVSAMIAIPFSWMIRQTWSDD
ncbi:hypothetical protein [Agrobacterium vitis]|uniref:hypothetical protein n=1 Tax=Agrobacterium vitis TaxID=373 RepID=UPI001575F3D8|nr:hypothetical protein G6L01_020885 [Agrobacterium vitis]